MTSPHDPWGQQQPDPWGQQGGYQGWGQSGPQPAPDYGTGSQPTQMWGATPPPGPGPDWGQQPPGGPPPGGPPPGWGPQPPPGGGGGGGKTPLIVGIVVLAVLLLVGGGVGLYFIASGGEEETTAAPTTTTTTTQAQTSSSTPSAEPTTSAGSGSGGGGGAGSGAQSSGNLNVGDCSHFTSLTEIEKTDCNGPEGLHRIISFSESYDSCPTESWGVVPNGDPRYACIDMNWVQGKCYETSSSLIDNYEIVNCDPSQGSSVERVDAIIQGSTDVGQCPTPGDSQAYTNQQLVVCRTELT